MLLIYASRTRFLIFCCIFCHALANDFDLKQLHEEDTNEINLSKEGGTHSSGLLYIDKYPEMDRNMTFTLFFPQDYHMVISIEYLRLSSQCNAIVEISNEIMKIRYCRSTIFHNFAVDTLLFKHSPVLLNISKNDIASPPKLELRYTVMIKNLSCDEGYSKCDNDYCIYEKFKCDGNKNCADGSDEMDAEGKKCSPMRHEQWDVKKTIVLAMVILIPISMTILCTFAACISYQYDYKKNNPSL